MPIMTYTQLIGLAVPYGFVLASLYLQAFWKPVGLNPFQYANAADLVSATIGGFVVGLVSIAAGILLGIVISPALGPRTSETAKRRHSIAKFMSWATVAVFGIFAAVAWFLMNPAKWPVTGFLLAFSAERVLRHNHWYMETFRTPRDRIASLYIVLVLPAIIFGYGESEIKKALGAKSGMSVDVERTKLETSTAGKIMYVGMLGDFHVLRELDTRSTLLIPGDTRIVLHSPR